METPEKYEKFTLLLQGFMFGVFWCHIKKNPSFYMNSTQNLAKYILVC